MEKIKECVRILKKYYNDNNRLYYHLRENEREALFLAIKIIERLENWKSGIVRAITDEYERQKKFGCEPSWDDLAISIIEELIKED